MDLSNKLNYYFHQWIPSELHYLTNYNVIMDNLTQYEKLLYANISLLFNYDSDNYAVSDIEIAINQHIKQYGTSKCLSRDQKSVLG